MVGSSGSGILSLSSDVLPDGPSIIFTTKAGNYVQTIVIRGSFDGDLFEASTRGRMNFLLYNYSATY